MSKIIDRILGFFPTLFHWVFSVLGIHDKQKKAIIVLLAFNFMQAPFCALFFYGLYQKAQWSKNNQHSYPAPAAVK